jgi:uncharacterized OsmC-like protein
MYRVEVSAAAGSSFIAKTADYEFTIDTKGKGATPPDVLLASLASCIGVYLRKYAEGSRIAFGAFTVTAEAEFSKEPPHSFRDISVTVDLKGTACDERRKAAVLDFIKNCPVHNTLKAGPDVAITLI